MKVDDLATVVKSNRLLLTELRQASLKTSSLAKAMMQAYGTSSTPPLLKMAEGLISAHRAARVDNDGYTLDLIEDALRHVGRRLAREVHTSV